MGLRFLEHFLILTNDPEGTRDWWCRALGFRSGDHPEFGFPVYWLYLGEQDVIHIAKAQYSAGQNLYMAAPDAGGAAPGEVTAETFGSARIDHVCFASEHIEQVMTRLDAAGIRYNERQVNGQALYQLFFREPINGVKIELNFPAEEARRIGRIPALSTADLAGR